MAYVIGSQKGKDKANEMKAGEEWYNTADGSTWKKNNDGSVSVTHNGQTFENAYKPSSGGSSSKNSQYTGYNYTIGSDYGKQQAQNMGIDTTWTATDGSLWTKEKDGTITVKYNGQTYNNAYKPEDYSVVLQQQMAAGVPSSYVEATLRDRIGKASKDPALTQYAYDPLYFDALNYINRGKATEWDNSYEADNPKAEYEGKYDPQIDKLLKEILNRDDFSYDAMNDPLYQQYAAMYRREGDRAMKETMAEAASGAGGMNTYAITAAQQANSYYNSQLNDKIPELYQLAYEMYLQDKESKVQDLGILQNMDATQYGRYRDTMSDYYADKNFAYGAYQDAVDQGNWETNLAYNDMWKNKEFNYNDYWANKEFDYNDEWKNKEWDEGIADKEYDRNLYDQESANEEAWRLINMGVMPDAELLAKAGMDEATASQAVENAKVQLGLTNSSVVYYGGTSGGTSGGASEKDRIKRGIPKAEPETVPETEPEEVPVVVPERTPDISTDAPLVYQTNENDRNFETIVKDCEKILKTEGKSAIKVYLDEILDAGVIDGSLYTILFNKYGR